MVKSMRHVSGRRLAWASFFLLCCFTQPAAAQFATGGSGLYKNDILWFSWGARTEAVGDPTEKTNSYNFAGNVLSVTCGISNVVLERKSNGAAPPPDDALPWLRSYRSGQFSGDGLDDLYNIGGTGTANSLIVGVSQGAGGQRSRFDFSCSATLNGDVFPLEGLVFAEAETSINNELVEVNAPGATPRLIDRYRACTTQSSFATVSGSTVSMSGATAQYCSSPAGGPMAVLYLEGATSGTVRVGNLSSSGTSAIALGVMIDGLDVSDAAASYGQATHVIDRHFSGGVVTNGQRLHDASSVLATKGVADRRLGATVDGDQGSLMSANADGDDNNGSDDEDALAANTVTAPVIAGGPLSLTLSCGGVASVAGWIDFNVNGVFDAGERSGIVACNAGTATLAWTVPGDVKGGLSYARFRLAENAAQIAAPTGVASSGEVEDHQITINLADYPDAPASYGSAPHYQAGTGRLGAAVTVDQTDYNSANASGDVDDAFSGALANVTGIGAHALTVPVSGVAVASRLCGYIDFNRNGGFETTERACADVAVGATSVPLSWSMPAGNGYVAGNSFLRLRMGTTAAQVQSATGVAASGEVEDYAIVLLPRVRLNKVLSPTTDPGVFNLSITPTIAPAGSVTVANVGNGGTTGLAAVGLGATITANETAGTGTNLNNYGSAIACSNRAGAVVNAPPATTTGTFTVMTSGAGTPATQAEIDNTDTTCVITNTRRFADLAITKTNNVTTSTSKTQTSYTVVASNGGPNSADTAVVRDQPTSGLSGCVVPPGGCVASGGATCPAAPADVMSASGVQIPVFPVGSAVTFTVNCVVD